MKVVFTFDKAATEAAGLCLDDVRHTVKKLFTERGLTCIEDGAKLAFEDVGREDDYADMWIVILGLLRSEWFIKAASSCLWEDEDGEEDVLAQAWKVANNKETVEALEEVKRRKEDHSTGKSYTDVDVMIKELLD